MSIYDDIKTAVEYGKVRNKTNDDVADEIATLIEDKFDVTIYRD